MEIVSEQKYQISQEVLIGYICTAILSHAEQTMFQAMCYTVSQHQIFRYNSYPFRKEPRRLEWQPVNKSYIDEIRTWVTDGRNNILDLNGTDIAISLMIEKE